MSRGWRRSSSRKAPSPYVDHMLHHTSGRFPAQEGVDAAAKARHPAGRAALRIAVVQDQEMLQLQLAQGILLGMAREFAVKPTAAPLSFGLKVFLLFIGTCLVTHALSCVHSAFASCKRSFEKKKREKENSPTSQSFRTSSAVSVCVTPPLPSTLRWMRPASSLGVPPTSSSGLLPSSPPTILHTLAILKTYIHLLPPSLLMLRLGLSVLRCFPSFAPSSHLRPSLFRRSARVTPPPLHSSKVPFALA